MLTIFCPKQRAAEGRSTADILDALTHYIQRNDVSVDMPVGESKVTISSRNLQNDEIDFKVKFNNGPSESRKSKLKKVAVPILTFILLKVITLVPLGLGILGIKAFNALQLSFFSFVISVGLAVFQLCRKVCFNFERFLICFNYNLLKIIYFIQFSYQFSLHRVVFWKSRTSSCISYCMGFQGFRRCTTCQRSRSRYRI